MLSKLRYAPLIAALGACSAVFASPPQLPPLTEPPTKEHHTGKVVLVELITPDLDASEKFYGGLFNWTFRDMQSGSHEYAQALLDGRPVAGIMHKKMNDGEQRQPAWLGFFSTRDVDAAKAAAVSHGAKVLFEPHVLPDRGKEAVFADPQGAVFAVVASSSGDPPDDLAGSGEWIWSSLITSDVDAGTAFYQNVFDYEVFDTPTDQGAPHVMLASENFARASVNPLPESRPDAHAHWLNFVRVDDAEQSAAKAASLGGRVIVAPRVDRHGGKLAIVADPQGAHFGLLEWPVDESKEVTP